MEKAEEILTINNVVEAKLLEEVLTDREIPYFIRSYHDNAYDGVFQIQHGWGSLSSLPEFRNEILEIYREIKGEGN